MSNHDQASETSAPALFSSCPSSTRAQVKRLYFDVDDTVTWQGMLPEGAAHALFRAADAGLSLVAVTGRSSGLGSAAAWGQWS